MKVTKNKKNKNKSLRTEYRLDLEQNGNNHFEVKKKIISYKHGYIKGENI